MSIRDRASVNDNAGHEFTLALTAFYHDGQEMYASTFFNTTIPVIDPPGVPSAADAAFVLEGANAGFEDRKSVV